MTTSARDEVPTSLGATSPSSVGTVDAIPPKEAPKYFRVLVDATDHKDGRPIHINVKVPILLLRAGVRFASFLPPEAQLRMTEAMHKAGMGIDVTQIKPEDVNEIIDHLRDLSIDIEDEKENVKVKVCVE